ncbi:polyamine aminopropyltransferase [Rhodopirellula sp. MGV]|uniref:polyamine aminopropyltransferase n=1 Tax=Rhodopirellula sp. MGV TaxID=2023130 RepID=UPI000B967291|nr:polyamine aminopropyltransferase [Rhodopirellula sp. MGV]OYP38169.1 spermidine synthase [Rhodopirellula sp. MGV]PNY38503.1 spermidine synthase [Rhodopirellula baltica]
MINRAPNYLLYLNVLVIATCGLIYELLAGTLASYLLGDSVTQFSFVIGVYLSALGIGSWLSKYVDERLARTFIEIELALALLGGLSTPLLFIAFGHIAWFQTALFSSVVLIGTLVGLELPLLMRIMREHLDFRELVARVLTFDYIGALLASVLFPVLLVPRLGLVRTSLLFGLLNAAVGLWGTYLLRPLLSSRGLAGLRGRGFVVVGILAVVFIKADTFTHWSEEAILDHPIVYATQSQFQRIVVTEQRDDFQLHLNGHLQFNSRDEYRYHEALVHPVIGAAKRFENVLVLGGGDGLAVREILRYPDVRSVTLVDLDPAMTRLATEFGPLVELNQWALSDPRVSVINRDAFVWIGEDDEQFDAAIIDFPDPGTYSVGKLYTTRFFAMLRERLTADAIVSVQCTSPLVAPKSYWCILETIRQAGFDVRGYRASVPTFGVWGFALAGKTPLQSTTDGRYLALQTLPGGLRYLDESNRAAMFDLPVDVRPIEIEANRLNDQVLVRYYEQEWSH